jgi:hypothetical protein
VAVVPLDAVAAQGEAVVVVLPRPRIRWPG